DSHDSDNSGNSDNSDNSEDRRTHAITQLALRNLVPLTILLALTSAALPRPYRWFEYLTLGKALENCRLHYLPQLLNKRHALILGDGDGRFLAQLLQHNPNLSADAVDSSSTMLQLLRQRCEAATPGVAARLHT